MNYIYDIVLNFQENYYSFFEWKMTDEIINIRKIQAFKVDNKTYLSLKNNEVKVNLEFINKLKNNACLCLNDNYDDIICLVTNEKEVMGLSFDNNGNLLKKSGMLFDEEEEVINELRKKNITNIKFISNISKKQKLSSRIIIERKQYLISFIDNLSVTKEQMAIKYFYYEYFDKINNNYVEMKKELLSELKNNWNKKHNELYNLILLYKKS